MGTSDQEHAELWAELLAKPPADLLHLERQLTGALHAVWRVRRVEKRIVTVEDANGYEQERVNDGNS